MKVNFLKLPVIVFLIVFLGQANMLSPFIQESKVHAQEKTKEIPSMLITEIVAKSTTVQGSDGYEFIEIYNNSNQVMNLCDYAIHYRYPENKDDLIWPVEVDQFIQPRQTFVFWIGKPENQGLTIDDFNENYSTDLVEDKDIIKIDGHSMVNDRQRTIILATKSGHEIVVATYNDSSHDVEANKGIFYKYPEDGSNSMVLISSATERATPGKVDRNQVPKKPIQIEPDAMPQIENLTEGRQAHPDDGIEIVIGSKNNKMVKTLTLFYKIDDEETYTEVPFTFDPADSHYHYRIDDLFRLLGGKTIQYYYKASNDSYKTKSNVYEIDIRRDAGLRLNVEDKEIISGKTIITGTGGTKPLSLVVDGKAVDAYQTFGNPAYFVFNGSKMNKGYQNAVTKGKDILFLMDEAPSGTLTVPVTEGLVEGENQIEIRSGDYHKTYFEDDPPEGKLNTFIVTDFRLLLSDGTVLRDPEYGDSQEEFRIGNAATTPSFREFSFHIPREKLDAVAFEWDTTRVADGEHIVGVNTSDGETKLTHVLVDNEAPRIETTIEEGKQYKGEFTLDIDSVDDISGVKSTDVTLDGVPIEVPYKTSSAELVPGEHVLQIQAMDHAGNVRDKVIHFSSVEEHPKTPEVIYPLNGAKDVDKSPILTVNVNDPTNDLMDVRFYQGMKYDVQNRKNIKVFKGETNTAPAQDQVPAGDTELTEKEYEQILNSDGEFFSTSSKNFPYLRLEVEVDQSLNETDMVQLYWEGQTLSDRKLSLLAWNYTEKAWEIIEASTGNENKNLSLKGDVETQDFVRDHKVNFMIQDQDYTPIRLRTFANTDYAYTFAWITDTQFNVESDPHIFKSQLDWIKDHIGDKKIKYVFHTGDIVNRTFEKNQWKLVDQYMSILDENQIPYGVLAGNHDVGQGYILDFDYSYYEQYFGEDRFINKPFYGGSYKNNRGHYDLISEGGNDYLMLYMGWGDGDPNPNWLNEDIEWMNKVLAAYPNRTAILAFHKYLHSNGQLEPANGQKIFDEVIVPNKNVAMVLSGHYTGSKLLTSDIDDNGDGTPDRKVYQILYDYQGTPEGGAGYMKLLHFDPAQNQVHFKTYSPYLDDFDPDHKLPGDNEYTLDLDLMPKKKQVATDYIDISVFSHRKIGHVHEVNSGDHVSFQWKALDSGQTYYWFVTAEDQYGGYVQTDMQEFTTKPIDLAHVEQIVNNYIAAGDIKGPLAKQLTNTLKQAIKFEQTGSTDKAKKHMEKFLKHLNNKPMQKHISPEAKELLENKVYMLIKTWTKN